MFLLEIFAKIKQLRPDAKLVLIGGGRLEQKIREKADSLGISDSVIFLGWRSDVNHWMKAMDVFLLPSLWEGLPNVAIEAQASALPIYMSENITAESVFTSYGYRLPLSDGAEGWAKRIVDDLKRPLPRVDMTKAMQEKGCDVRATAKWYERFYLEQYARLTGEAGES